MNVSLLEMVRRISAVEFRFNLSPSTSARRQLANLHQKLARLIVGLQFELRTDAPELAFAPLVSSKSKYFR